MTKTSIISKWATDDTLVKKAVEEDLKHNHVQKISIPFKKIDPIAKKVDDKKKERVLEYNSDDYEDIFEDDSREGEGEGAEYEDEDEYEDGEIIPIPKFKLSKEVQRLFPVEDFKSNKEDNKDKAKHILPTGPKSVKSKSSGKHPRKHIDDGLHTISPPPSREKDGKKETHIKKIIYTGDLLLGDQKKVSKKKTDLSSKWASTTTENKTPMSPPNSSGNGKETIGKQRVTEKNKLRKIRELERERIRKAKSGRGLEWDDGKRGAGEKEKHFKVPIKNNYEKERNRNDHAHAHVNVNVDPIRNGKNNYSPHKSGREPHEHFAFDEANDLHRETKDDYDDDDEIEVDNAAIEAVMAKLKDASIDWTADDNDYF